MNHHPHYPTTITLVHLKKVAENRARKVILRESDVLSSGTGLSLYSSGSEVSGDKINRVHDHCCFHSLPSLKPPWSSTASSEMLKEVPIHVPLKVTNSLFLPSATQGLENLPKTQYQKSGTLSQAVNLEVIPGKNTFSLLLIHSLSHVTGSLNLV
jgi:hypothetical protein